MSAIGKTTIYRPFSTVLRSLLRCIVTPTKSDTSRKPKKRGQDPSQQQQRRQRQRQRQRKMPPIATSTSCGTLVDVSDQHKKVMSTHAPLDFQDGPGFTETHIYLPGDDHAYDEEDEDECDYGCLSPCPSSVPREERLRLPSPSSAVPLDTYLSSVASVVESAEAVLAHPPFLLSARTCKGVKVLNVRQGEIGHCVPSQADVIVSDRATTCHIIAMRSQGEGGTEAAVTLCHLDKPGYANCLREALEMHLTHHREDQEEEKKSPDENNLRIAVDMHVVGGYSDADGTSLSITQSVFDTFTSLAEGYSDSARMTLRTCAVGRLNDCFEGGPMGRGLAVNVSTGEVYLAKVDDSMAGPAGEVRSARLWSSVDNGDSAATFEPRLSCVHKLIGRGCLMVEPFFYEPFPEIDVLLSLDDSVMLQYTSTSPDVEEEGFCDSVRSTLAFVRDTTPEQNFGERGQTILRYRRGTKDVNSWVRMSL